VAQALQLSPGRSSFPPADLGADMVEYVLGDPLSKSQGKTPVKNNAKTPSPFEADQKESPGDRVMSNGDDGFR